jgi:hypothetical protein
MMRPALRCPGLASSAVLMAAVACTLGLVACTWGLVAALSHWPTTTRAAAVPLSAAELAQLDAQARVLCTRDRGENAGFILLPDGVLVCTNKPARRPRSEITTAWKASQ